MDSLGIYIHIPFCIKKCNYCDFCSFSNKGKRDMQAYCEELCRRIREFADKAHETYAVDTVYFGGGTPTLLPVECFEALMRTLRESFDIAENAEITAECNPASIDGVGLFALRKLGINRLSIGAQSASDGELRLLGRVHSFADMQRTFTDAREAGFQNISVDLMYGIPDQTPESFAHTLEQVCLLSPEHISAYCLKIEEGTPFASIAEQLRLPDEDTELEMYSYCEEYLSAQGYERYEISNFAKRGYASTHNMRYWQLRDYIGFGVSAHSCIEGERFANSGDIDAFYRGENIECERRSISVQERLAEYVMLSLRLSEGLDCELYKKMSGRDFLTETVKKYIDVGFLQEREGRVSFTTRGFFVSNPILAELIDTSAFE